jgi:DNA repair exonuclease SbcCD nuclease subunit
MAFKFSHLADCHIGGWRDQRMKDLSIQAFHSAINTSIERKVDFILIAGDLFNTAIPDIDSIKSVISLLRKLKNNNIPCYFIPGSHDFSPSGKTFLDVIEEAGLGTNVYLPTLNDDKLKLRFIQDKKTGVKITGMLGRKGQLDSEDYKALDYILLEKEEGFKIFMFHTSLTEMKPKELEMMESVSVSILPVGFNYYAGGHVHIVKKYNSDKYKNVIYPGPLFPNSFSELEKLGKGGFYIVNVNSDINIERIDIELKPIVLIEINADNMTVDKLNIELKERVKLKDLNDAIVLLRVYGTLNSGRISDIEFNSAISEIDKKGAYFVMRNTSKLNIQDMETKNIDLESSDDIERELIQENKGQFQNKFKDEINAIMQVMNAAASEKLEGEKTYDYESRVLSAIDQAVEDNKND